MAKIGFLYIYSSVIRRSQSSSKTWNAGGSCALLDLINIWASSRSQSRSRIILDFLRVTSQSKQRRIPGDDPTATRQPHSKRSVNLGVVFGGLCSSDRPSSRRKQKKFSLAFTQPLFSWTMQVPNETSKELWHGILNILYMNQILVHSRNGLTYLLTYLLTYRSFGTSQRLKTMSSLSSIKLDDSVIQLSDTVKILGNTLDSSLTIGPHTKATSKSCFYHIHSFRQIRSSMDHTMAISVASALVSSRLDYTNSLSSLV